MLEICFDYTVYAQIKAMYSAQNSDMVEIAVCPDNLSIGALVPFTPQNRFNELVVHGIEVPDDFIKNYQRFFEMLNDVKKIRIWISNSPHESLGLYFISDFVYPQIQELCVCSMSYLPQRYNENCLSCLPNKDWQDLITYSKNILIENYSGLWQQMLKENTKLRIYLNRKIVSVSVNYFDKEIIAIAENLTTDDLYTIAGTALGSYIQRENVMFTIYFFIYRVEKLLHIN